MTSPIDPPEGDEPYYALTLFVSGASALSARAIANARQLCDVHLNGHCELTILDAQTHLQAVREHRVLVTPTLIKHEPPPSRHLVGDLADGHAVARRLRSTAKT
jgi:circadian clock protein KaiB